MKKLLCFFTGLVFANCYAQPISKPGQFEKVFEVISSDRAFSSSFSDVLNQLGGVCANSKAEGTELLKKENVVCDKATGVRSFSMPGADNDMITMIQSSFFGVDKCSYMVSALNKRYGKPESKKGACEISWKVKTKRGEPERHASIEADEKANVVYFDLTEDQGSP